MNLLQNTHVRMYACTTRLEKNSWQNILTTAPKSVNRFLSKRIQRLERLVHQAAVNVGQKSRRRRIPLLVLRRPLIARQELSTCNEEELEDIYLTQ